MTDMTRPAVATEAADVVMGQEYTDVLTGIKGKAVAVYIYVTGCDQVCLLYTTGKRGEEKVEHHTVDASRLLELQEKSSSKRVRPGGPSKAVGARF